jgi:L-alanine-DL-glutamate epimerase-like enolase superfamily enzyme
VIKNGHVAPPTRPGFGVTIDEDALKRLTMLTEVVQ